MEKALRVPSADSDVFLKLVNLPNPDHQNFVAKIHSSVSEYDIIEPKEFLGEFGEFSKVLMSLLFAFTNFDESIEVFLKQLYKTYISIDKKEKEISEEEFISKMEPIFSRKNPLFVQTKSKIDSSEVANEIVDWKIMTDIRPIFSFDKEETILGSVTMNYFNIVYAKDGERNEIYLKMSKKDLLDLKDRVEKAINKVQLLQTKINEIDFLKPLDK